MWLSMRTTVIRSLPRPAHSRATPDEAASHRNVDSCERMAYDSLPMAAFFPNVSGILGDCGEEMNRAKSGFMRDGAVDVAMPWCWNVYDGSVL